MGHGEFWARLYAEVRDLQGALPDDAAAKQRGCAILSGPPVPGELLLMGLHPRREPGGAAPNLEHGSWLQANPTERDGAPSQRLGNLIAAANLPDADKRAIRDALARANETYLWFLGASGAPEWKDAGFWGHRGEALRSEVEAACLAWHERMLPVLKPGGLLCVGLAIHGNLAERWGEKFREREVIPRHERPGRLAVEADIEVAGRSIPFLALRQSLDDWASAPPEERAALGAALGRFSVRADIR